MAIDEQAKTVLDFWFNELSEEQWFAKDEALDQDITQRFGKLHLKAAAGELWRWRETIQGRLAEIILLDQFSRNMFRESPDAFKYDNLALALSQEAISSDELDHLDAQHLGFLYMPFMHSESPLIQDLSVLLFSQDGLESFYPYAQKHADIIHQFGRYPHRNTILNRESTEEEQQFLKEHDGF